MGLASSAPAPAVAASPVVDIAGGGVPSAFHDGDAKKKGEEQKVKKNTWSFNALAIFLFNLFFILCDITAIYLMSCINYTWISIVLGVGYLLIVFPRFDNDAIKLSLQCFARVVFWFALFLFRFVCLDDVWTAFLVTSFLVVFSPFLISLIVKSDQKLSNEEEGVLLSSASILSVVILLMYFCGKSLNVHQLSIAPPPYNDLSNNSYIERPLLRHHLAADMLRSESITVIYGRQGTGRRSLVAKTLMDDYDAVWIPIDASDEKRFQSMFVQALERIYGQGGLRYELRRALKSWKFDCEAFGQRTRQAFVVDYSLIDLTRYDPNDLAKNDMKQLNEIASLGIKVIVVANEMVSIFDAARRANAPVSFIKVDGFAHDEAVRFFNHTASSSALSISTEKMDSLFARVGTRPIDIRNYASDKDWDEYVHKAKEAELQSMMGWIKNNGMTNSFVESDSCLSNHRVDVLSRWHRCGVDAYHTSRNPELASRCAEYYDQLKIVSTLLMNPNGFQYVVTKPNADINLLKSLVHIVDIDIDNNIAHIKPRSMIQKTLLEEKKIVHIHDCSSLEMKVKKSAVGGWLSRFFH